MLYLLKSFGPKNQVIYKVGYASDVSKRLRTYTSANPYVEKISEAPGELLDEKAMHLWLHSLISDTVMNEWYICESTEKILNLFGRLDEAKAWVWSSRASLGIGLELWEHLYSPGSRLEKYDYHLLRKEGKPKPTIESSLDQEFLRLFLDPGHDFVERLRRYCDYRKSHPDDIIELCTSDIIPKKYHEYYDLGEKLLSACSYQESKIKSHLTVSEKFCSSDLREAVLNRFSGVSRITKAEAKKILSEIYKSLGINKTAKATDLSEFFNITEINMTISGKRQMGFKLENK